jgi:hypothetical protein
LLDCLKQILEIIFMKSAGQNRLFYSTTLALAYLLLSGEMAQAYLDPGTGSMLLQGILAAIATGVTVCGVYWQKLKDFLTQKNKKLD